MEPTDEPLKISSDAPALLAQPEPAAIEALTAVEVTDLPAETPESAPTPAQAPCACPALPWPPRLPKPRLPSPSEDTGKGRGHKPAVK